MTVRWKSVGYDPPREDIPTAVIYGYEGLKEYFILQELRKGQWEDVGQDEE